MSTEPAAETPQDQPAPEVVADQADQAEPTVAIDPAEAAGSERERNRLCLI